MEAKTARKSIIEYFSGVKDPRTNRNKMRKHPLAEVIIITILAVISSAKGWEDIERYGKAKRKWLEKIALEGCIVTIDAMGCQQTKAEQIVGKKADYVFSLKGNQGNLHEAVEEYWEGLDFNAPASAQERHIRFNSSSTYDKGHGREEYRDYAVSDDVAWLHKGFPLWKTIRSIGMVEETMQKGKKITIGRRYFVSSLEADTELFARAVRSHWGIENSLHYVLDVAFGEDACRIRKDKGPENMAFIRKIALTLARSDQESKSSMVGRLKEMGWDNDYLERMLFNSSFGANSAAG